MPAPPSSFPRRRESSFARPKPTAQPAQWTFEGNMTRPVFTFDIDPAVPAGARVWIATMWYDTRGKPGPVSDAISVRVQDGVGRFQQAA